MSNEPTPSPAGTSWREQAVARSLDAARTRAEARVQRFVDAAIELMNESESGKDFTIQEVVEKSEQSLRSFYLYFGGKQELLLAVFEDLVASTAEQLRAQVEAEAEPMDRLHQFVVDYYRLCRAAGNRPGSDLPSTPPIADFAQNLLTAHPADAAHAFTPLVSLFEEVLGDAVAAGDIRADVNGRRLAGIVLEAIMFNAFSTTIGGSPLEGEDRDPAEELWDLIVNGIGS
jgi:AcrR family transcriptional regulator